MMQQFLALILVGLGLQTPAVPPSVLGDQDTQTVASQEATAKTAEKMKMIKQEAQAKKTDLKNSVKQNIQDFKQFPDKLRESGMASRTGMLEERKQLQEKFKADIENKREEAKAQFETQREAFKKRLETIKDETKKERVTNVDTKMSETNTKRTTQMTENLNKMDEVITKITTKLTDLEAQGVDTSKAQSALSDAQSKMSLAKAAVSAQASKEYVIGVTSENNLGQDVGRSIQAMQKDFQATATTLKNARESITTVLKELALISGQTPETQQPSN